MAPASVPPATPVEAPRRPIRRLDERTIREIAAGEVIERPASVVKELLENALDAHAREVRIQVEEGGLSSIQVADDGDGIPESELALAFERHATSKLSDAQDLPTVRTLGFRGEALASIGAIAKVRLSSRATGDGEAREIRVEGGAEGRPRSAARAQGTTVEVRELFFNTPARRKFLRSAQTEALKITETVESVYLARPEATLRLSSPGRPETVYPAAPSLREATARVFGPQFLTKAFEFSGAAGPGIWAEGVASHPEFSRGTSRGIVLAVDGRWVVSKGVQDAVRYAYREVLPQGRYPVAVVHLTTEPGRVDVNVHPTKREVRFERESELREALTALLRARLRDQPRLVERPGAVLAYRPGTIEPLRGTAVGDSSESPALGRPVASASATHGLDAFLSEGPASAASHPPVALPESPGSPWTVAGTSVHPSLRLLGQVGGLYIVAETRGSPGELVLVDAHAASERVLYERLRAAEPAARQRLLVPLDLELTPRQRTAWEAHASELTRQGFDLEPFGGSAFRLRSVPFFRGHRARPEGVTRLLDELADGGRGAPGDALRERVAKSAACHLAIRAGDELGMAEMARLLGELFACPESFTCPHGRPIVVALPRSKVDRWFLRP